MSRFNRPPFNLADLQGKTVEEQTRLQSDWWGDDKDREAYLDALNGDVTWIHSRAQVEDDPAPPRKPPPRQGHAKVALISSKADVTTALSHPDKFGNIPYAELGGASFMLALDPLPAGSGGTDWHGEQQRVALAAIGTLNVAQLRQAADCAVKQAEILSLQGPNFDLADFAEQAALRYFGLLFGFSTGDHVILEDAARRGYRALQYLIVGRHFTSEPTTLPAAQQALARLSTRCSALMDEYARLERSPRKPPRPTGAPPANFNWPDGVQPWADLQLSGLGDPLLRILPGLAGKLSGQDLCSLVGGLLVGTVGNVRTSLCLMLEQLFLPANETLMRDLRNLAYDDTAPLPARWSTALHALMAKAPPVPFLPRRALNPVPMQGATVDAGIDCIIAIRPSTDAGCPWGNPGMASPATHACLGQGLIEPLLVALLQRTVKLPGLEQRLDPLDGQALAPERLWGMGCSRYLLHYRRDKVLKQQPLIVVMRIKAPVAENAERLRHVISGGAPRIKWALDNSSHVHMAWFEFMENDSLLALRTVYDGDFDAYIQHFALKDGDLFDQLFECIEGAPPMPVAEHPNEFVETIRRYNRAPAAGFFYCAYPRTEVTRIPK
jgi:hypothetical protein